MVSQHIDIFCGHWPGANGDVKYLTFHVTPQDFMNGSTTLDVTKLTSLVVTSIIVKIKCFQFVK